MMGGPETTHGKITRVIRYWDVLLCLQTYAQTQNQDGSMLQCTAWDVAEYIYGKPNVARRASSMRRLKILKDAGLVDTINPYSPGKPFNWELTTKGKNLIKVFED